MKKRIHAFFRGHVQGVGFRFTAESLARSLGIVGWVKNLAGGGVEIIAEQQEETLQDFIAELEQRFQAHIRHKDCAWESPTGEFKDFGIRF